ncbi:MAG TPA: hypothetical protein VNN19_01400 [bacterium]|nr:hypothetical protein [bacterium]
MKAAGGEAVDDALRQTIIVPDLATNSGAIDNVLRELQAEGFEVVNVKNRFALGERGYKDVNLKLVHPDMLGLTMELQLITSRMLRAKLSTGHDLYDYATKYLKPPRREAADDPRLVARIDALLQKVNDDMVRLYDEALEEDRAAALAANRLPTSAKTAINSAAVSGESPLTSEATGRFQSLRAVESARRLSSAEAAESARSAAASISASEGIATRLPPLFIVPGGGPRVVPVVGRGSRAAGARGTQVAIRSGRSGRGRRPDR